MSKAVMIIETMPEACDFCKLRYDTRCMAEGGRRVERYSKPSWCPLRELPAYHTAHRDLVATESDYKELGKKMGWNKCLDAITGGSSNE